jgi:hypothetical protein
LRDDETMELPLRDKRDAAKLTPEKRKRLVLAADQVYERELSLLGYIEALDFFKSPATFRLRLTDGGQAIVPMPDSFHNNARVYSGYQRHQVSVRGVGAFDSWDRLQKVIFVESLDVIKNYAIATRLDEISQLEDGWFEGRGVAPDAEKLTYVFGRLIADYPDKLPLPQIVPTQDGNLLLEWAAEGDPSLDIDLTHLQASFHAFGDDDEDIERSFNLKDAAAGWNQLFAFLNGSIKVRNV